MATAQLPSLRTRVAHAPFFFNSEAHLLRILPEQARDLAELLDGLRTVPDGSIFEHTFQTLQEHHFITEGFSNDFAQWAFAACNEVALAEQFAGVDVREFTSVRALRQRLIDIVATYLEQNPRARDRQALQSFHFCATCSVVVPTPFVSRNLEEFADALRKVSIYSIHFHFIEARLRLKLKSNDFSVWLEEEMELPQLADRVNQIDIYTSTLDEIRRKILLLIQETLS